MKLKKEILPQSFPFLIQIGEEKGRAKMNITVNSLISHSHKNTSLHFFSLAWILIDTHSYKTQTMNYFQFMSFIYFKLLFYRSDDYDELLKLLCCLFS